MSLIEFSWDPTPVERRRFAWIWTAVFALLGVRAALRVGAAWPWSVLLWAIAGVGGPGSLLIEPLGVWLYRLTLAVTFPIGWTVSHVLLALIYYVMFAGTALIFRWVGRDALQRKLDRKARSYWIRRPPASALDRYFSQY